MDQGYLQVYSGDGKGKTTAALGLILRALGAGLSVHLVQLIKNMEYSELTVLQRLGVPVDQFGRGCFLRGEPDTADIRLARDALSFARGLFEDPSLDLLILDEVNVAIQLGLIQTDELMSLVYAKPRSLELVCTGRGAPPELIQAADLVSEMTNVKHYYDAGVPARAGIER